ncbi:unnamed protein product [Peniophora sp. CBMAI 1063]|nr:unnamed protein product [Peniophora sp. CBMAI 1063]
MSETAPTIKPTSGTRGEVAVESTFRENAPEMPRDLHRKYSIYGWRLTVSVDDFPSRWHLIPRVVDLSDVRRFYEEKAQEAGIRRGINILMLDYDKATKSLTFAIWLTRNFLTYHHKLLSPRQLTKIPTQDGISRFGQLAELDSPSWCAL